ncbi:amino acid carrier protein [Flavobacteriaceae bacterium Ap0902]|nr:amino acid carrier protein [Flavobacteriaceae bacterium Ap0902]
MLAFGQNQEQHEIADKISDGFTAVADAWSGFVFYPLRFGNVEVPVVVIILVLTALIFTVLFKFPNIRLLPTSINILRGKYDNLESINSIERLDEIEIDEIDNDEDDAIERKPKKLFKRKKKKQGEVSHFQALTTALSGTVGLGNIAGVAIALSLGGPGATFWMMVAGFLGMSSKFVECTLAVKYRDIGKNGKTYGGPMYYLKKGLADVGKGSLGKFLAIFYSVMIIGGSIGNNMFQSNQSTQQFVNVLNLSGNANLYYGIATAILVGVVLVGGIKRIGQITEKIVPFMVCLYILTAIIILIMHYNHIGNAFSQILDGALNPEGIAGGFFGVLVQGFKRAAFSNEAAVGTSAIAHSAVKTNNPSSEGLVALLEPFIDTVVVCTMTALIIIITNGDGGIMTYGMESPDGVLATSKAFSSVFPWFSYILTVAVMLFAFSTVLSWSYYGLQGWVFLFGRSKTVKNIYKILFCVFVVVGSISTLGSVTDFFDAMIFAMVVPNVIGLFFLFPKVKEELSNYLKKTRNV